MTINHKFTNVNPENNQLNWDKEFYTENSILKNRDIYNPEILILGTFNPDLNTNKADFFYGRNYFWTGFKNLFCFNNVQLHCERLATCPYNPSLNEIFSYCKNLKLTFADLIKGVFNSDDNNTILQRAGKEYLYFNDTEYNLILDSDLESLDRLNKVNWNTENIIKYLLETPTIKTIYFTRNNNNRWKYQIEKIKRSLPNIKLICIYTPSAQGGALHQQTGIINQGKMIPLLRHWVHNNQGNYGNLNHNNWLTNNGVNINNF